MLGSALHPWGQKAWGRGLQTSIFRTVPRDSGHMVSFSALPRWSEEGRDPHWTLSGHTGVKAPGRPGLPVRVWGSGSAQWGGAQPGWQWHSPLWLHTWG